MRRLEKEIIVIKLHDISKQYVQPSIQHDQKETNIRILVGLFLVNIFNQKNFQLTQKQSKKSVTYLMNISRRLDPS